MAMRSTSNFTFDSLTGSSPNGALTSHSAQTFASPSGKAAHRYVTAPGQLPVDPNYEDNRAALSANWTVPITRVTDVTVGAKVSGEDDFFSLTLNASVAHDFNDKNTTVSAGVYDEFDSLRPIGGAPAAGSDYALADKTREPNQGRNRCLARGHPGHDAKLALGVQSVRGSIPRLSQ